jgi:hypothetical protein
MAAGKNPDFKSPSEKVSRSLMRDGVNFSTSLRVSRATVSTGLRLVLSWFILFLSLQSSRFVVLYG